MFTRAAILHALNAPLTIETLRLADPGPREVCIAIAASGVCHSDFHVISGQASHHLPVVLGHVERARERTRELLANPKPRHIPPDVDRAICKAFPIRLPAEC